MRLIHALLDAMRIRRTRRIGLTEADRWVVGDRPGPDHQGLAELLSAARAPASADELAGEEAAVAAFAATHRRAASLERRSRVRMSRRATMAVVNSAAGLALIAVAGTAVAARTGNLPDGAQQHAHRLFSALGVPAPRTSPPGPAPTSAPPVGTPKTTSRPPLAPRRFRPAGAGPGQPRPTTTVRPGARSSPKLPAARRALPPTAPRSTPAPNPAPAPALPRNEGRPSRAAARNPTANPALCPPPTTPANPAPSPPPTTMANQVINHYESRKAAS
jgi:hypothetical protein